MKLRALIVDDEPTARRTLQNLIENYATDIEIIGSAEDVLSGVKTINKTSPDLVFLDVRMPNYSGFSLIDYFDDLEFKIIFTTAYEEYAEKAFLEGASGYLLKPIDIDDLNASIERIRVELQNESKANKIKESKSVSLNATNKILTLPFVGGLLKLNLDEILFLEAKGRQVLIHLKEGESQLGNISLKSIQDVLHRTTFLRIHKSYMVNFIHVKKYTKGKDSSITLYDDTTIEVGKVFKENLNQIVSYLPK